MSKKTKAAAYLNEALLEGDEVVFKTAIANVIRARGIGKKYFSLYS